MRLVAKIGVTLVVGITLAGCISRPFKLAGVSEMKLSQIHLGQHTEEDVRQIWGAPPFIENGRWQYPVQSTPFGPHFGMPKLFQAVRLKVWFDGSNRLADWAFYHPTKNERLVFEDTLGFQRNGLIDLDALLSKDRAEAEVMAVFRYYYGSNLGIVCRRETDDHGPVVVFYVDRPGRYFIPPSWVQVSFDGNGRVESRFTHGYK